MTKHSSNSRMQSIQHSTVQSPKLHNKSLQQLGNEGGVNHRSEPEPQKTVVGHSLAPGFVVTLAFPQFVFCFVDIEQ